MLLRWLEDEATVRFGNMPKRTSAEPFFEMQKEYIKAYAGHYRV